MWPKKIAHGKQLEDKKKGGGKVAAEPVLKVDTSRPPADVMKQMMQHEKLKRKAEFVQDAVLRLISHQGTTYISASMTVDKAIELWDEIEKRI